jgi:hypothetical protein
MKYTCPSCRREINPSPVIRDMKIMFQCAFCLKYFNSQGQKMSEEDVKAFYDYEVYHATPEPAVLPYRGPSWVGGEDQED